MELLIDDTISALRLGFWRNLQYFHEILLGRVGVGSASEQPHLKMRYINACNKWMNER